MICHYFRGTVNSVEIDNGFGYFLLLCIGLFKYRYNSDGRLSTLIINSLRMEELDDHAV